jgi:hypothetical protein
MLRPVLNSWVAALCQESGSPVRNIGRTFRAEFRWLVYKRHRSKPKVSKTYRNPVALALEWLGAIDGGDYSDQADLARKKGLSRARVTQVLNLLRLAPRAIRIVLDLGDPLPSPMVTERQLRQLINLPRHSQLKELEIILGRMRSSEQLMIRS